MATLRKMLGSVDNPNIISLMRLIETQSKETLSNWAVEYAAANYLPIYEKHISDDAHLRSMFTPLQEYFDGHKELNEVKPIIKEMSRIARQTEPSIAQAAVRAIATACGTITTPTNALGFAFYGAAATAYDCAGLVKNSEEYEALATEEFEKILASLQSVSIKDEANPVKINWNC